MVKHATEALGPIDILVNNAGSLVERRSVMEMTKERWNEIINLNLTSAMLCSQAVTSSMLGCFRDEQETRTEFLSLIRQRPNGV